MLPLLTPDAPNHIRGRFFFKVVVEKDQKIAVLGKQGQRSRGIADRITVDFHGSEKIGQQLTDIRFIIHNQYFFFLHSFFYYETKLIKDIIIISKYKIKVNSPAQTSIQGIFWRMTVSERSAALETEISLVLKSNVNSCPLIVPAFFLIISAEFLNKMIFLG